MGLESDIDADYAWMTNALCCVYLGINKSMYIIRHFAVNQQLKKLQEAKTAVNTIQV